jgi:hypothetical protein
MEVLAASVVKPHTIFYYASCWIQRRDAKNPPDATPDGGLVGQAQRNKMTGNPKWSLSKMLTPKADF